MRLRRRPHRPVDTQDQRARGKQRGDRSPLPRECRPALVDVPVLDGLERVDEVADGEDPLGEAEHRHRQRHALPRAAALPTRSSIRMTMLRIGRLSVTIEAGVGAVLEAVADERRGERDAGRGDDDGRRGSRAGTR